MKANGEWKKIRKTKLKMKREKKKKILATELKSVCSCWWTL